jgi:hypothetical protein
MANVQQVRAAVFDVDQQAAWCFFCMILTPEKMLKKAQAYEKNMRDAKKGYVAVGLPTEKASKRIYENGKSVIDIGASHEYGIKVPIRSFLSLPFDVRKQEISDAIVAQFKLVYQGKPAKKALSIIGIVATQIVQRAFTTQGYGHWQALSQKTIDAKGSSQILIDTGILRGSITYVVRGI